jgi:hypothetical protein
MKKISAVIFVLLIMLLVIKPVLYAAVEPPNWLLSLDFGDSLKKYIGSIKDEAFSSENQTKAVDLTDMAAVFLVDLLLSGFCLWLSIWILFKSPKLVLRVYLWFVLIINLSLTIILIIFKIAWKAINTLVISQAPELETVILDKFAYFLLITAVIVFIWLMARSFNLHFFGTLEAFFVSQALYLLLVFIIIVSVGNSAEGISKMARENFGIKHNLRTYFSEMHSVAYGKSFFNLQKMRVYHL